MDFVKLNKDFFDETPFDLVELRNRLASRKLSEEELASLAIAFTDSCFCEYRDTSNSEYQFYTLKSLHSNYVLEAMALLLEFGLNPNTIVDDENVMWNATYMDAPNVAASVLKLLLEHGGNPNHLIPSENETLFDDIDFKVVYERYSHEFFHLVQCWLLLMAYGGCCKTNHEIPLVMCNDYHITVFKDFEYFDYTIEKVDSQHLRIHIFNTETKEEVAISSS